MSSPSSPAQTVDAADAGRSRAEVALEAARLGGRLSVADATALLASGDPIELMRLAHRERTRRHGRRAYYRHDLNLNPTNVCVADCGFCAFYRKPGQDGAYAFSLEEVRQKARAAREAGVDEFHVVGGLHPDWGIGHYEEMFRILKAEHPGAAIQGLTAVEVDFLAVHDRVGLVDTLRRLRAAGLDSLPGGGAEVLHPGARKRMLAAKITSERFLEVHRVAHGLGIPTNVTILFGHVETPAETAHHLGLVRDLQDETHGFSAFVCLAFNPEHTELARRTGAEGPTGLQVLRMVATARLFLDNVDHVKVPWVTTGKHVAGAALSFGADDIGGTAHEERILEAAGGRTFQLLRGDDLGDHLTRLGFEPVRALGDYRPARTVEVAA